VVLALTMASSGTFLHTGLKLPYYHVFRHGSETGGAGAAAQHAGCDGHGSGALHCDRSVPPGTLCASALSVDFEPYTGLHVTESLSLLMFTALGFVLFLSALGPENTISLDTDWFYRKGRAPLHVARRKTAGTLRKGR